MNWDLVAKMRLAVSRDTCMHLVLLLLYLHACSTRREG